MATGSSNGALLTAAEVSIDATITNLESNSILKESCDNAAGTTICDADQVGFNYHCDEESGQFKQNHNSKFSRASS